MPLQPASADPPDEPEDAADPQAEDAQFYRRVLHQLIELGADLACMVHRQAAAQADAAAPADRANAGIWPDPTGAFERVARTIRRSINLARSLGEPVQARAAGPAQHRIAARRRIIREVEDTIQRSCEEDEGETLHAELLDRLDAPELDEDIQSRPVTEIIAEICRDLGIAPIYPGTHPWKRRTPADLAELCARAAEPAGAAPRAATFSPGRAGALPPRTPTASDPPSGPDEARPDEASLGESGATLLLCPARFRGK